MKCDLNGRSLRSWPAAAREEFNSPCVILLFTSINLDHAIKRFARQEEVFILDAYGSAAGSVIDYEIELAGPSVLVVNDFAFADPKPIRDTLTKKLCQSSGSLVASNTLVFKGRCFHPV
jgi:hypothetical protein